MVSWKWEHTGDTSHQVLAISVYEEVGILSFEKKNQLFKQLLKSILIPAVNWGALSSLKGEQEEAPAEDLPSRGNVMTPALSAARGKHFWRER